MSGPSFLDAFTPTMMDVEIVLDNAKSHAKVVETTSTNIRLMDQLTLADDEMSLEDLVMMTRGPTNDHCHDSNPEREVAPTGSHKGACRWASSSSSSRDEDFAHVHIHLSFDGMLKEDSSRTHSALTNVTRPVRRTSLKSSPFPILEADQSNVLYPLSSNLLKLGIERQHQRLGRASA